MRGDNTSRIFFAQYNPYKIKLGLVLKNCDLKAVLVKSVV